MDWVRKFKCTLSRSSAMLPVQACPHRNSRSPAIRHRCFPPSQRANRSTLTGRCVALVFSPIGGRFILLHRWVIRRRDLARVVSSDCEPVCRFAISPFLAERSICNERASGGSRSLPLNAFCYTPTANAWECSGPTTLTRICPR